MKREQGTPPPITSDVVLARCPADARPAQALDHVEHRKGRLVFRLPTAGGTPLEVSPLCGPFCEPFCGCTCPPPVCVCTQPCISIASPPPGQSSEVVLPSTL